MLEKLKNWWKWNPEFEKNSADNPVTALSEDQRRNAGPLLALAFGWGFLVTGLFTGGLLGNGRLLTCRGPATIEDGYSAWIKGKYIAFSKQIFMFNIITYAASNFEIIFDI